MPITRAKASQLLNQREMALYDDSRINGLRQLDAKALATRITRARAARDRARDLVRRQKLASRSSTGSKRGSSGAANQRSKDKAELMADILERFETKLREVERQSKAAAPRKTAKQGGTARPGRTSKVNNNSKSGRTASKTARKTPGPVERDAQDAPAASATARSGRTKKVTTKKAATRTGSGGGAAKPASPRANRTADRPTDDAARATAGNARRARKDDRSGRARQDRAASRQAGTSSDGAARTGTRRPRKRKLSPEEALAQTQALLEAKQARDAEPKPWAEPGGGGTDPGAPGYQSASAARRAKRLHAAEIRLPANQGSVSTHDRINQGKRDHRGRTDD